MISFSIRKSRPTLRVGLSVLFFFIFLEASGALALRALDHWSPALTRISYLSHLKQITPGPGSLFLSQIPHPYFGTQGDKRNFDWYNNYGFMSRHQYPYVKSKDEFVIGIFGGSVAESFARHSDENGYLLELSNRIPALRGKKIVVINLAVGGGKQPQQFFIATYFMDMIDLVLNLDGFNDINGSDGRYPADYPQYYHALYQTSPRISLHHFLLASLRALDREITTAAISSPILGESSSYRLFWITYVSAINRIANRVALKDGGARESVHPFFDPPKKRSVEMLSTLADIWERYLKLEYFISQKQKRSAVFFIQPNQYAKPSKPFSEEERKSALSNSELSDPITGIDKGYSKLRDHQKSLNKSGIPVYDLSGIFQTISNSVYQDNCCHLNKTGEQIMAKAIIEVMANNANKIFNSH